MLSTHNNPVATEEERPRLTLRDLAAPIVRRKRTLLVTFLFVVSITVLLGHMRLQKYQSARGAAANTVIKTQGNQSLNEADLAREAKLDEQNYLLSLSTPDRESVKERARNPLGSNPAVIGLVAVVLGLLISLATAYIVDYCDPCFHSPVQVIRTLGIPLVVAIPKRSS